jgi:hypothetical protein
MTVFANKDAFLSLGLEQVRASASHASQDCSICTKPLAVHDNHNSPQCQLRGYHFAVRINSCGHTHGEDCLNAWLDVGNSCPTCNRIVFELDGDPITQADANNIVYTLGPEVGEARVMIAVVAAKEKRDKEHVELRQYYEQEIARQKMEDTKVQDQEFTLGGDDFLDSDDDMDFGEEDGDEDYELDREHGLVVDSEEPKVSA